MKLLLYFIIFPILFLSKPVVDYDIWGATGHRVIGEVASQHISKRTKKAIKKLLEGQSLAYISNYADDIKSDKRYRSLDPSHYANLDLNESYLSSKKNPKGDIVKAISKCISVLKNKNESYENKQFNLKLLVHFIGDIHQPMHLGKEKDRGGNKIEVKWFGKKSNLHRIWDSNVIDSNQMSYSEISYNLPRLTKNELLSIKNSPLSVWIEESHLLANKIYTSLPENKNLGYAYRFEYFDIMRLQLLKGGLRLAYVLDEIFN
jgi:hypothetical protein